MEKRRYFQIRSMQCTSDPLHIYQSLEVEDDNSSTEKTVKLYVL